MKRYMLGIGVVALFATCVFAAEGESIAERNAKAMEQMAADAISFDTWDAERVKSVAQSLSTLPDDLAAKLIWMAVSVPPLIDTTPIFASALQSPSPEIRQMTASLLSGGMSIDATRFLLNSLAVQRNDELGKLIIQGMANLPRRLAVRSLMDIMFVPGIPATITDLAATELRRLTRSDVGNDPGDWRDWWLENENRY